ncbi:MAG: hypothetical protein VXY93_15575, partial [Pseudomonadota bacterium]|nr:hypothetical protein [Pseudomonadota bacterium]
GVTTTTGNLNVTDGRILIAQSTAPQLRINSSSSDGSSTRFSLGLATASNNFINGASSNDACIAAPSNILFGIGNTRKFRIKTNDVLTDVDFIPSANDSMSLGRSNARWSDLFAVDANISGDLDVDGHTNLDNVSIAGVSTFTGNADFSAGIDVTGNSTFANNLTTNGTLHISSVAPILKFTETDNSKVFHIVGDNNSLSVRMDSTGGGDIIQKWNSNGTHTFYNTVSIVDV